MTPTQLRVRQKLLENVHKLFWSFFQPLRAAISSELNELKLKSMKWEAHTSQDEVEKWTELYDSATKEK